MRVTRDRSLHSAHTSFLRLIVVAYSQVTTDRSLHSAHKSSLRLIVVAYSQVTADRSLHSAHRMKLKEGGGENLLNYSTSNMHVNYWILRHDHAMGWGSQEHFSCTDILWLKLSDSTLKFFSKFYKMTYNSSLDTVGIFLLVQSWRVGGGGGAPWDRAFCFNPCGL